MNKAELASRFAERLNLPRRTGDKIVELFQEIITQELTRGGEVTIAGFGTFSARRRAGRKGVNPRNPKEPMDIPSVIVPKFKAGKALKDALKGKRKINETEEPATAVTPPEQTGASAQ